MFGNLLKKAARNACFYNISSDVNHLVRVFPSDPPAASKHLLSFIENVFLAMEHSATSDELIIKVGTQLGEQCDPALGFMLFNTIQGMDALRRKDKVLADAKAAIADSIFREQTGTDGDTTKCDILSRYFSKQP